MSNIEDILYKSFELGIKDNVFGEVKKLMEQKKYYNLKLAYEEAFNNVIKNVEIKNFNN
jgi:hypothetical protein